MELLLTHYAENLSDYSPLSFIVKLNDDSQTNNQLELFYNCFNILENGK